MTDYLTVTSNHFKKPAGKHNAFTVIILLLLALHSPLFAQQPDEFTIKNSDEYHYGTGDAATEEEAKTKAKSDMINNIMSFVSNEQTNVTRETSGGGNSGISNDTRNQTTTYSHLKLKNLQYLKSNPSEGTVRILAYISKVDFAATIEETKTEVREFMKQIELREKSELLEQLIPEYYSAYLMTFHSPELISYIRRNQADTVKSLRAYLELKIRGYLSSLSISTSAPFQTPGQNEQIEIPITASYRDSRVSNVVARLSIEGNPERTVENGKTTLYIYNSPSSRKSKYWLLLSPPAPQKDELLELHHRVPLTEKREIEVDFSQFLKFDFSIHCEEGKVYAFRTTIKNLSISKTEWDFGDGRTSDEHDPKHIYETSANYKVTLRINGDESLTVSKPLREGMEPVTETNHEQVPADSGKEVPAKTEKTVVIVPPEVPSTGKLPPASAFKAELFREGQSTGEFTLILEELKKQGKAVYGKKSSFSYPDQCWILLMDKESGAVKAMLQPGSGSRKEVFSGKEIQDYKTTFKGMTAIWIEAK